MTAKHGEFEESGENVSTSAELPEPIASAALTGLEHKLSVNRFEDVDVEMKPGLHVFDAVGIEVKPGLHNLEVAKVQLWALSPPWLSPPLKPSPECKVVEVPREALPSWLPSTLEPTMPTLPARLERDSSAKTPGRPRPSKLSSLFEPFMPGTPAKLEE
jgi:hypothetical protein